MSGRRLYDQYTDATAREFNAHAGTYRLATEPLPAWASLSNGARRRWNDLARRITPKPKAAR